MTQSVSEHPVDRMLREMGPPKGAAQGPRLPPPPPKAHPVDAMLADINDRRAAVPGQVVEANKQARSDADVAKETGQTLPTPRYTTAAADRAVPVPSPQGAPTPSTTTTIAQQPQLSPTPLAERTAGFEPMMKGLEKSLPPAPSLDTPGGMISPYNPVRNISPLKRGFLGILKGLLNFVPAIDSPYSEQLERFKNRLGGEAVGLAGGAGTVVGQVIPTGVSLGTGSPAAAALVLSLIHI